MLPATATLAAAALLLAPVAANACPDWVSHDGARHSFTGKELYSPRTFEVVAGGAHHLPDCGIHTSGSQRAVGYAAMAPDFTIAIEALDGYALEFRVVSACDATLLINTAAQNYYFDDDSNGNLDPKIRLTQPSSGIYDIWIGTIGPDTCNARLTVETF